MPRLDPVGRKELVTNILDQWNVRTGNSISLVAQDATDPMLVTLKDNATGQTSTNSLTALFPGSPGLAENMSQMQPAMVEKRQMERDYLSLAQQAEARQQGKFQLEKQQAANELPPAEKKRQETLAAETAKLDAKFADESIGKAHEAKEYLSAVHSLKGMIKNGKVQMGPEGFKEFARNHPTLGKFITKASGNDNQNYSALAMGLLNAIQSSGIRGITNTQFEEDLKVQLPTIEKNPEAALGILDRLSSKLEGAIKEGKDVQEAIKGNNGMIPSDIRYRRNLEAPKPKPMPRADGKIYGVMPDGVEVKMTPQALDAALQKGFKPYD
jgi:hypothetical protein